LSTLKTEWLDAVCAFYLDRPGNGSVFTGLLQQLEEMKMKIRQIAVRIVLPLLLSGCAPVPSYSVDPYIGSLKQCLDIQGTYESSNFYTPPPPEAQPRFNVFLIDETLPKVLGNVFWGKVRNKEFRLRDVPDGKKAVYFRVWMTYHFLDDQRLAIYIFNEFGQEEKFVFNMKGASQKDLPWWEEEELTCNASSWQKSYTKTTGGGEGGGAKERRFVKITKTANGALKKESEWEFWRGRLGLYALDTRSPSTSYHRKVDLTVEDIRANNEKAKKAIAQYDEFVTSPPQ
jgi:hypothetical protein